MLPFPTLGFWQGLPSGRSGVVWRCRRLTYSFPPAVPFAWIFPALFRWASAFLKGGSTWPDRPPLEQRNGLRNAWNKKCFTRTALAELRRWRSPGRRDNKIGAMSGLSTRQNGRQKVMSDRRVSTAFLGECPGESSPEPWLCGDGASSHGQGPAGAAAHGALGHPTSRLSSGPAGVYMT